MELSGSLGFLLRPVIRQLVGDMGLDTLQNCWDKAKLKWRV